MERWDFDQRLECAAPKYWLKCITKGSYLEIFETCLVWIGCLIYLIFIPYFLTGWHWLCFLFCSVFLGRSLLMSHKFDPSRHCHAKTGITLFCVTSFMIDPFIPCALLNSGQSPGIKFDVPESQWKTQRRETLHFVQIRAIQSKSFTCQTWSVGHALNGTLQIYWAQF